MANYIDNKEMLSEVILSKEKGEITPKLANMMMLLAERYSHRSWFVGYTYRDDMVCDAIVNLCQNALKFDPEKSSNPFAYYTMAVHRCFRQFINNERKHRNIRDRLLVDMGENPSFNYTEEWKELMKEQRDSGSFETDSSDNLIQEHIDSIVDAQNRKSEIIEEHLNMMNKGPIAQQKAAANAKPKKNQLKTELLEF